jgi:biotin carboxyl carrier protein
MNYKAITQDHSFDVSPGESGALPAIDGKPFPVDIQEAEPGYFHLLFHQKSYRAEVVSVDAGLKRVTIKINGKKTTVEVKDKFDLLLEKMGMKNGGGGQLNVLKAPMPGLIIDLKVGPGDTVKAGEPILILEAMKMENVIKSPGAGTIRNVRIKKGDRVEKSQVLIEF